MRRIALPVVVLMLMSVGGLAAATEPVTVGPIYPGSDPTNLTVVHVGDTVLLGVRWGACTQGLAWMARNAIDHKYRIRPVDDNLDNDDAWVEIHPEWAWQRPVPAGSDEGYCIPRTEHTWLLAAQHPYVFTEAGDYEVQRWYTITRPMPDGGDYDGDGRLDVIPRCDWELVSVVPGPHIVRVLP